MCYSNQNYSFTDQDMLEVDTLPANYFDLPFEEKLKYPHETESFFAMADVLLTGPNGEVFLSEAKKNVGLKYGKRIRWREECDPLMAEDKASRSIYNNGNRPPGNAYKLSGKATAGHHSACFLTEDPLDSDHGNVACFASPMLSYYSPFPIMPSTRGWVDKR